MMDRQINKYLKRSLVVVMGAVLVAGCTSLNSNKNAAQESANKVSRAQQLQNDIAALTQQVSVLAGELNELKGYVMSLGNSLSQAANETLTSPAATQAAANSEPLSVTAEPELAAELKTESGLRFAQRLVPRQSGEAPVFVDNSAAGNFAAHMKIDKTVFYEAPAALMEPKPMIAKTLSEPVQIAAPMLEKAQLVSHVPQPPVSAAVPANLPGNAGESVMIYDDFIVLRVAFHPGQTEFNVSPEVKQLLLRAASESKFVDIQGYTDADVGNKKSELTAANRAQAAFNFLQANGVDADRMTKAYKGAGGFYVENKTAEGRTKNRRVEIALIGLNARKYEAGQVLARAKLDPSSNGRFVLR